MTRSVRMVVSSRLASVLVSCALVGSAVVAKGGTPDRPFSPFGQGMGMPEVLDLTAANRALVGFQGGFTNGRYAYFVPHNNGPKNDVADGVVARVDLQQFEPSSVKTAVVFLDVPAAATDTDLVGFESGFTDGRYGYLVPQSNGKVVRLDLQSFPNPSCIRVLDLAQVDPALVGFAGGFTDGRFGYFVPHSHGIVARVDLQKFEAPDPHSSVTPLTLVGPGPRPRSLRWRFH